MRFLIVPENNSLSHIAKSLAICDGLFERNHEVLLAVGQRWVSFVQRTKIPYVVLEDIRDCSDSGFPSVGWFRDDTNIDTVIDEERSLLESYRPDRVLGIFRFTLKAAAELAGIRYDSLVCGCLLPGVIDAYGYKYNEVGGDKQAELMSGFFRYAGARLSRVLTKYGLDGIEDAREMLLGERTFLWDFPQFLPIDTSMNCTHVGPINWMDWPVDSSCRDNFKAYDGRPLAVLSFGTCVGDEKVARYLIEILGDMGFHILWAAGGQSEMISEEYNVPWLDICEFAPLHKLWPQVRLLISNGGQMTIFEALRHGVPVAVMPFQPEQAHNGVCLEMLGCGRRLTPGQPFLGNSNVYIKALFNEGEDRIREVFIDLLSDRTRECLTLVEEKMDFYRGTSNLLPFLERA